MKKFHLFLALITLVAFTSCREKEGIDGYYNPKNKISKIYKEDYAGNKHLYESWNWDKKQLKSIEVYEKDGNISNVETYYYDDDGRIVMVHNSGIGIYTKYFYNDELLDYMEYYFDDFTIQNHIENIDTTLYDVLAARFDFTYNSDNKFSEIKGTEYKIWGDIPVKSVASFNPFRFILPEHSYNNMKIVMQYNAERSASKNDTLRTTIMNFEWEDDNISKCTSTSDIGKYVETYKYDDKTNPYNNLYDGFAASVYKKFSNKNNITYRSYKWNTDELSNGEYNFTYEYQNDLPIKRVTEGFDNGFSIGVEVINTGTYHYEYE